MIFLRSTLFNLCFYGLVALECLLFLPGLLLPRKQAMMIVGFFVRSVHLMEKYILGLDYEVRGTEYLPKTGAFIVAAKHQSPYETLKLHLILRDPAVILKKELLDIPLWGKFLAKSGPIAIDRKAGKQAVEQIVDGAQRVKTEGRPIVIFPQGTRVRLHETTAEKPYRAGVARMKEATGLPLIPLALNTGLFWPRSSWVKKPGKVVFEFLPPVPDNFGIYEIMKDLETRLESESDRLAKEAGGSP